MVQWSTAVKRIAIVPALLLFGAGGCRKEYSPPPRPLATYTFSQHVSATAFDGEGTRAAIVCGAGNEVHLIDVGSGVTTATLTTTLAREAGPPNLGVHHAAFSPDGKYLATAGWHGCELWRLENNSLSHAWVIRNAKARGLAYAPSGRYLYMATGDVDPVVLRFDVQTHESKVIYREADNTLFPLRRMVRITRLAVSPDGLTLALGVGGGVVLVDSTTGTIKRGLEGKGLNPPTQLTFSHSGSIIAASGGPITTLDATTGNVLAECPTGMVNGLVFSPDDVLLVSVGDGSTSQPGFVEVWRVTDGKKLARFACHSDAVLNLAFVPKTRKIATGSADKTLQLWDLDQVLRRKTGLE